MRRKLWLFLAIGGLIAAATGIGLFHYIGEYGRAEEAGRLSDLLVIRQQLLIYARANGKYPDNIRDALPKEVFWRESEFANLEYVAAGRAYPLQGDKRLFYESESHRYGFEVGWFEFWEHNWFFHRGER